MVSVSFIFRLHPGHLGSEASALMRMVNMNSPTPTINTKSEQAREDGENEVTFKLART